MICVGLYCAWVEHFPESFRFCFSLSDACECERHMGVYIKREKGREREEKDGWMRVP